MKDNKFFKENVVPALVLVIICLVVTAALACTYSIASPIIAENEKATADAARAQVLAAGDAFTLYEGELAEGVTECYTADNGAGIAVTSTYGSFGGILTAMVGIDKDGKITGVTVTGHADTPGLGTKAMEVDYLNDNYNGLDCADAASIKDDANVDAITGATISSNAVYQCVKEALAQYENMKGNGGLN